MNERTGVTDKILDYCQRTPGFFLRKIHCGAMQGKGQPDLWGCYRGMVVVCESKTPDGRLKNPAAFSGVDPQIWRMRFPGGKSGTVYTGGRKRI